MITCKSKEGVPDNYLVSLFAQSGSHQPDMSATQHKIYFINRKERDEIRYHHGLDEGLFYDYLTTSKLFLAYGKNVDQAITFPFRFLFDAKILVKDCYRANRQPEYRHSVKLFFVIFHVRLELRRINVLVRGLGVSLSLFSH